MSYDFEEWRKTEEMEAVYTMPEASEAIKATIINMGEVSPEKPIMAACSDDRAPTRESIDALVINGLPADRPYLRIFGGKYGAANLLIISATAQYGVDGAKEKLGGDYKAIANDLSERSAALGVIMATHSDENAEGNPSALNAQIHDNLACAKAANLGAINLNSEKEQLAIRVGETDAEALLGSAFDAESFSDIPQAVAAINRAYMGGEPRSFAISREDVLNSRTPAIVLKDKHAATKDVKHVFNLTPDKVSDPREAVARGVFYYHTDLVPFAEILMRAYPELDLDPKIILEAGILDAASTRMALSAIDGDPDPSRLETVRYGDGDGALEHLYEVRQSLSW